MKPKIYRYEGLSGPQMYANGMAKEEAPMDLSVKRPTLRSPKSPEHSVSTFPSSDLTSERTSILYNELANKCMIYNGRHQVNDNSPGLLPYLLLRRNYDDDYVQSVRRSTSYLNYKENYDEKHRHYSSSEADYHNEHTKRSDYCPPEPSDGSLSYENGSHISPYSSSPLSSSSRSPQHYNETRKLLERSPILSPNYPKQMVKTNRSHCQLRNGQLFVLKKASSEMTLSNIGAKQRSYFVLSFKSWKSESDLTKLPARQVPTQRKYQATKIKSQSKPIKLVANYCKTVSPEPPRKYSKLELLREAARAQMSLSDEEYIVDTVSEDYISDDALDLRMSSPAGPRRVHHPSNMAADPEIMFNQIHSLLNNSSPNSRETYSPQPVAGNPWDIYKQYYYYLLHQPAIASRAAVAAAMADAYGKLASAQQDATHPMINSDYHHSVHHPKIPSSISPDYINGKTELRSADTTNGVDPNGERKRISRPLTGRHVKHGPGASPATLLTLRNMIQQRQRLKELGTPASSAKNKRNQKRNQKKK